MGNLLDASEVTSLEHDSTVVALAVPEIGNTSNPLPRRIDLTELLTDATRVLAALEAMSGTQKGSALSAISAAASDHTHTDLEFDLHEQVGTEAEAIDDSDRIVISDESETGEPNRYVELSELADHLVDAANVLSALEAMSTTNKSAARTALSLTGAGIKTLLEALASGSQLSHNNLDDTPTTITADQTAKLLGIATGATIDQTGANIVGLLAALEVGSQLSHNNLDDTPTTITSAQTSKLLGIAAGATIDQTGANIVGLLAALEVGSRLSFDSLDDTPENTGESGGAVDISTQYANNDTPGDPTEVMRTYETGSSVSNVEFHFDTGASQIYIGLTDNATYLGDLAKTQAADNTRVYIEQGDTVVVVNIFAEIVQTSNFVIYTYTVISGTIGDLTDGEDATLTFSEVDEWHYYKLSGHDHFRYGVGDPIAWFPTRTSADSMAFDLYENVSTVAGQLANDDRMVIADISLGGEDNRYVELSTFADYAVDALRTLAALEAMSTTQVTSAKTALDISDGGGLDIHEDLGTESTSIADTDRIAITDESESDDPTKWATADRFADYAVNAARTLTALQAIDSNNEDDARAAIGLSPAGIKTLLESLASGSQLSYNSLDDTPTIPTIPAIPTLRTASETYALIDSLLDYDDLTNKPTIPTLRTAAATYSLIDNLLDYGDLSNTPTIPTLRTAGETVTLLEGLIAGSRLSFDYLDDTPSDTHIEYASSETADDPVRMERVFELQPGSSGANVSTGEIYINLGGLTAYIGRSTNSSFLENLDNGTEIVVIQGDTVVIVQTTNYLAGLSNNTRAAYQTTRVSGTIGDLQDAVDAVVFIAEPNDWNRVKVSGNSYQRLAIGDPPLYFPAQTLVREFDLYEHVATLGAATSDQDRFVYSDVSINGEPNRYATASHLASYVLDIHSRISTELTGIADADRIAITDESENEDPIRWATADRLADYAVNAPRTLTALEAMSDTQATSAKTALDISDSGGSFDIHDDLGTELTTPATDDRLAISDESESGEPIKYITVADLGIPTARSWTPTITALESGQSFDDPAATELQTGKLRTFTAEFIASQTSEWYRMTGRVSLPIGTGSLSFVRGSGGGAYPENVLFVLDSADNEVYRVTESGTLVSSFGTGAANPSGIAYGNGHLWIIDPIDDEVYKVTESGGTVSSFDTLGFGVGEPSGITYGNGHLWIIDSNNNRVYKVTESGGTVSSFDTAGFGASTPKGIAYGNGHLWIIDSIDDEVYKVTESGTLVSSFDTAGFGASTPKGIAYGNGHLWIIDSIDDEVYKVTESGTLVSSFDTAGFGAANPSGIAYLGPVEYGVASAICELSNDLIEVTVSKETSNTELVKIVVTGQYQVE